MMILRVTTMTLQIPVDSTCQGSIAPGSAVPSYTFNVDTGEPEEYSPGAPLENIDLGEIGAPLGIMMTSAGDASSFINLTLEGDGCDGVTLRGTVRGFGNHPFDPDMVEEVQTASSGGELETLFEASGEHNGVVPTDKINGFPAHAVVIQKPL